MDWDDRDTLRDTLEAQQEHDRQSGSWAVLFVILAAVAAMLALYAAPTWPLPVAIFTLLGMLLAGILLGDW